MKVEVCTAFIIRRSLFLVRCSIELPNVQGSDTTGAEQNYRSWQHEKNNEKETRNNELKYARSSSFDIPCSLFVILINHPILHNKNNFSKNFWVF
jgi:hypothetical protein